MSQLGPGEFGRRRTEDQAGVQSRIRCPSSLLEPCRSTRRIHPWSMREWVALGAAYQCFSGGGIYRSTDAADHWTLLNPNGIFSKVAINRIVLPTSGTLLVATNQGLYKSIDGGNSFGDNDPKFDNGNPIAIASISNGNISDLKLPPRKPRANASRLSKSGCLGYWRPSLARYSARGSHWPRCKPRDGAVGEDSVTPAN
jgi:hypothetical protein